MAIRPVLFVKKPTMERLIVMKYLESLRLIGREKRISRECIVPIVLRILVFCGDNYVIHVIIVNTNFAMFAFFQKMVNFTSNKVYLLTILVAGCVKSFSGFTLQ